MITGVFSTHERLVGKPRLDFPGKLICHHPAFTREAVCGGGPPWFSISVDGFFSEPVTSKEHMRSPFIRRRRRRKVFEVKRERNSRWPTPKEWTPKNNHQLFVLIKVKRHFDVSSFSESYSNTYFMVKTNSLEGFVKSHTRPPSFELRKRT